MDDIETFVRLKYEIPVSLDYNFILDDKAKMFDLYPPAARDEWTWRIALEVEFLADGCPALLDYIQFMKEYHKGCHSDSQHLIFESSLSLGGYEYYVARVFWYSKRRYNERLVSSLLPCGLFFG